MATKKKANPAIADLQALAKSYRDAVNFNYQRAERDPSDAEYRKGYAAAAAAIAFDLETLIVKLR